MRLVETKVVVKWLDTIVVPDNATDAEILKVARGRVTRMLDTISDNNYIGYSETVGDACEVRQLDLFGDNDTVNDVDCSPIYRRDADGELAQSGDVLLDIVPDEITGVIV